MTTEDLRPPIEVVVVGGYLGAGKTTFVNQLLRQGTGRSTLVLVNDFGAVAIDAELVTASGDGMAVLANGCVCCGLSSPLIDTLVELRGRDERPELVVVECSGVADPTTVAHHAMIPGYRLEVVVVLADAETVRRRAADPVVGRTVRRQLESADLLLLNKSDLVGDAVLDGVEEWLRDEFGSPHVVRTVGGALPVGLVVGSRGDRPQESSARRPAGDHHDGSDHESSSWSSAQALDRAAVEEFVAGLPAGAVRAKGVLLLADDPSQKYVLQAVGRRWSLEPSGGWDGAPPATQLVVVGVAGSLSTLVWPALHEK